ncbi:glycoprotein 3-alpha-L-fucosyltransferase A-like [Physella acuta]|uniref:glycoprotein 3-alpha-L-fucosyltransferase A-like n=1 Tax=Physella acuta TaxID=109671 RepID=UPI0027DD3100|nr:glycoprotein 3-alpha-L-fucosyltransferase A-like [Physella acuta]
MRFRLKKTIQVLIACACVLVYINFHFAPKSILGGYHSRFFKEVVRKLEQPVLERNSTNVSNYGINERMFGVNQQDLEIYPKSENYDDDRILAQLRFVPRSVQNLLQSGSTVPLRKIFLYNGLGGWDVKYGQESFLEQKCAVPYCEITDSRSSLQEAHVVLLQGIPKPSNKPPHQKWLLFLLESPYHTPGLEAAAGLINWTATYRRDSTIVAPYEKFVPFNASVLTKHQEKNYALGKTKKVAWFVSNCGARNGRRQYADELAKYIQVDIYGTCGTLKCPRYEANRCFDMLNTDYKFYLSFENSNCRDYITEKFFVNGLKHDVIPIVMGAAPEDYRRAAPPHSFIHVDDFESPKALAEYLHTLDNNDNLYNEYFQWKGTGDLINTHFWCRVCALAHDDERGPSWYTNLDSWWRGAEVCIGQDSWRNLSRKHLIGDLPVSQLVRNLTTV